MESWAKAVRRARKSLGVISGEKPPGVARRAEAQPVAKAKKDINVARRFIAFLDVKSILAR
jgi:hypothetical protein